jgi:hypothetical protein
MVDHCRVLDPRNPQDQYGNESDVIDDKVLYDGRCFVSPGNMWSFETGLDVVRGGRTDVQIYVPRSVENLTPDCVVEYDDHRYEVIAFGSRVTGGATINITARRVS